jgi:hypothetical protein
MSKFNIMKDVDGQNIDLSDLATQYEIATGRIFVGVDRRDKDKSMKYGGGMVDVVIKRAQSALEIDDGTKTKEYQDLWALKKVDYWNRFKPCTEEEEKIIKKWVEAGSPGECPVKRERKYTKELADELAAEESEIRCNPAGGSLALHKLLFIDAEAEILEALSKHAKERTEDEINELPTKYKNCPNMGIFIRYDISKLKQKAKPEEKQIISLACILLMNFYNQMRDHERKIAEGKSLSIADSFWLGRLLGRIIALDFEHRIKAGINIQKGTIKSGEIHAKKIKKSDPAGMTAFMDKYFKDNTTSSYKPSFTTAAIACAKSFNCSVKTVRNSVINTYTNIE